MDPAKLQAIVQGITKGVVEAVNHEWKRDSWSGDVPDKEWTHEWGGQHGNLKGHTSKAEWKRYSWSGDVVKWNDRQITQQWKYDEEGKHGKWENQRSSWSANTDGGNYARGLRFHSWKVILGKN